MKPNTEMDLMNQITDSTSANFGQLFKFFRQQAGFSTISQFADALADHNVIYCESLYYHWQSNNKIPTNRKLLLQIIQVFVDHDGLQFKSQVNSLLEAADKGYITNNELLEFPKLETNPTINQVKNFYNTLNEFIILENEKKLQSKIIKDLSKKIPKDIRFNFMIEEHTHRYLVKIATQEETTKSNFIRKLITEYQQKQQT
jgi:hypothetical protein